MATASAEFFPLRRVVDEFVADWLARHPGRPCHLIAVSLACRLSKRFDTCGGEAGRSTTGIKSSRRSY